MLAHLKRKSGQLQETKSEQIQETKSGQKHAKGVENLEKQRKVFVRIDERNINI